MNNTRLRARDIDAHALSTLTAPHDAHDAIAGGPAAMPAPSAKLVWAHRMILALTILGVAAPAVAFGFLNSRVFPATTARTHQSPKATAALDGPRAAGAEPAMMKIVPAEVLDPSSLVFIGTGDGSNGSWVRP
jgi:hypothetical protein